MEYISKISQLNSNLLTTKFVLDRYFSYYYNLPLISYPDTKALIEKEQNERHDNISRQNISPEIIKFNLNKEESDGEVENQGKEIQEVKLQTPKKEESEKLSMPIIKAIKKNNIDDEIGLKKKPKIFKNRSIFKTVNMNLYRKEISNEIQTKITRKKIENPKHNLRPDCLRKRIKTHLLNYLLNAVNKYLAQFGSELFLFKLPNNLIADARFIANQKMIRMTVKELFSIDEYQDDKVKVHHNIQVMSQIEKLDDTIERNNELIKLINFPMSEILTNYLKSPEFEKDCYVLEVREGSKYVETYKKFSRTYLEYYLEG